MRQVRDPRDEVCSLEESEHSDSSEERKESRKDIRVVVKPEVLLPVKEGEDAVGATAVISEVVAKQEER